MSVEQLISPIVPVLTLADTGNRVLELMDESKLAQLPVVSEEVYMALARESDVLEADDIDSGVADFNLLSYKPSIIHTAHPYDALKIMSQLRLSVLPVVDGENKYVGSITTESLLEYLNNNSSLNINGGIIVLEIAPHNYTLYEIARICENEDVAIVDCRMRTTPDGTMIVTLKTNRTELEPVISSFERHNYVVKEVYGDLKSQEDLMGKYALFMNYLNM